MANLKKSNNAQAGANNKKRLDDVKNKGACVSATVMSFHSLSF
jgi:hypothetical protein